MDRKNLKNVSSGTGGAVPVKNEKGEISMQKVKVQRYIAGKRPKYATTSENEEDLIEENMENESEIKEVNLNSVVTVNISNVEDRRLKRLMGADTESTKNERNRENRHRRVTEPEILHKGEEYEKNEEISLKKEPEVLNQQNDSGEEEINEEERLRRRLELKKKALQKQEELLVFEEEKKTSDDELETEESEYFEEYSDSEEEIFPRLKPVFIKKQDRVTIQEKELELEKEKEIEKEKELLHMEAKKQTRKMIEDEVMKEKLAEKTKDENIECDFLTDDENTTEEDYESWKLRALKRIKRDREERERSEKEKQEIQRIRNMTEEERTAYLTNNPKILINQATKGKYKFLQKYYHRGAFFMDQEDEVFKRNFAEPTLEDHFDKTILPKVMQVKNFGMSGRTKYTHLLDQDTTRKDDDPWVNQDKFFSSKAAGTKQIFDKPSKKNK